MAETDKQTRSPSEMVEPNTEALRCLVGGGEMGALMRAFNWASTSLGAIEDWSQSLQTSVSICLNSRFPMVIWWGDNLTLLYNDAWRPILGSKHPQALGQPGQAVWSEIWDIIGIQLRSVLTTGQATWSDDMLLLVDRSGYVEEAYFTYSYSPILIETGHVGGAFTAVTETTARVLGERRLATLRDLATQAGLAKSVEQAYKGALQTLSENSSDLPFALLYQVQAGSEALLYGSTPITDASTSLAYEQLQQQVQTDWLDQLLNLQSTQIIDLEDLEQRFGKLPSGPWTVPIQSAIALPLQAAGQEQLVGLLIVGVNPCRELDDDYRNFLNMVAGHIGTVIANATAYEEERRRAEALAELDRAKTTFFSNVSHEFRTPLTLMLGPLADILATASTRLDPEEREQLEMSQRNGLRLQKLVNTLLDFSRIEAGRVQAVYEPTDLATFTAELASVFRSAIERAGMTLQVNCPKLPEAVYVDREMWEKIVLNLLSNAFKFTFAGSITVTLQVVNTYVELSVEDTGTGIPAQELPHLFERFRRVEGAKGRSYEGSGIGLSLVQELVKLHGGTIEVKSVVNQGTCFVVRIPSGTAHLPSGRIGTARSLASTSVGATPYVEEALGWLKRDRAVLETQVLTSPDLGSLTPPLAFSKAQDSPARILLVDDNADMRDYVQRLLSQHYIVESVADGATALSIIAAHSDDGTTLKATPVKAPATQERKLKATPVKAPATQRFAGGGSGDCFELAQEHNLKQPFDLILSDVMMPGLDGFGLLRQLRADPLTRDVPVILLSARAGEESRVEGLEAGADEYLIKPFSARELFARVEGTLKLARMRKDSLLELAAERDRLQLEIAERQWAEAALSKSNDRLNIALDAAALGLWDWNLLTNKVTWTEHHARLWGMSPETFDGTYATFEQRVHPEDRATISQTVKDAITQNGNYAAEYRVIWQDNSVHWIAAKGRVFYDEQGQAVRMVGIVQDITAQKQADQERETLLFELATVLQKLNFHFENSPLGVIEWDAEFRVSRWSKEAERIFGWQTEEVIGKHWSDWQFIYAEDVERVTKEIALLESCTSQLTLYNRNYAKDGSIIHCEWYNSALLDESGNLVSILSLALNVSERIRLEQERERLLEREQTARAEAEQANRVKDEFLAVLSHELRTPLNPILGWSKLLKTGRLNATKTAEALSVIERNAQLQTQLIEDLLDVSRILQGKLVLTINPVDLKFVIAAAQETVRLAAEAKGIEVETTFEPGVGTISGDAARLQQVVWNLISNAVKFTPEGGRVIVRLAQVNNHAQIQVTDTGKGISAEFLPYVFDYFRQADSATTRKFGGLGLGLAIVRQIVELHGGTVKADSPGEGQGATFTVTLPLAVTSLEASLNCESSKGDADLSGIQILVVDDEVDSLNFVAFVLEDAGATVVSADSPREALQTVLRQKPDILVSDIGMPDMDGYMLIQEIRASLSGGEKMPAIALTAYAGEVDQQQALLAGFARHLPKPVNPEQLVQAIVDLTSQA
ncbi:MAG: response regulator [Chroococcidiopsidaceae cyanobacterium CP_BM_RX_35]|nr:response regulator [Chroococcidiopsidaceae cyanobacterium CP_BM_RX_35]